MESVIGGEWWRFARYELRDGYLQPAAGSSARRYDPWPEYDAVSRSRKLEVQPPYQSLFALINRLRFAPRGGTSSGDGLSTDDALHLRGPDGRLLVYPTPASEQLLLTWCAEHGLLGVLLHQVAALVQRDRQDPARISQLTFSVARWSLAVRLPGGAWPDRVALRRDLDEHTWILEPFEATWARFFQGDDLGTQPLALCEPEDFWRRYAEPLEAFLDAAVTLRDAVQEVPSPGSDVEESDNRLLRHRRLEGLLAPVGVRLDIQKDGTWRQRWDAPSLLGTFALMAAQDLTSGRPVRRCSVCGTPFVAGDPRADYCRPVCRWTGQKRKQQAKARAAASRRGRRGAVQTKKK